MVISLVLISRKNNSKSPELWQTLGVTLPVLQSLANLSSKQRLLSQSEGKQFLAQEGVLRVPNYCSEISVATLRSRGICLLVVCCDSFAYSLSSGMVFLYGYVYI